MNERNRGRLKLVILSPAQTANCWRMRIRGMRSISSLLAAMEEFIGRGVGLFCKLFAMLLVALWPAVTSHTLLTHGGLIHVVHALHDHARAHHEEHHDYGHGHEHNHPDDGRSHEHHGDNHAFADGDYRSTTASKLLRPALSAVFTAASAITAAVQCDLLVDSPGPAPPGSTPQILRQTWQFSNRTAVPGRAPSFLS